MESSVKGWWELFPADCLVPAGRAPPPKICSEDTSLCQIPKMMVQCPQSPGRPCLQDLHLGLGH